MEAEPLHLICPECAYELRGITSDRCPECGLVIDRATLSASRLPWEHRFVIGRVRAYWRTNLLVLFHQRQLACEMNWPVSFRDAQRFRHLTVLLAWMPAGGWIVAFYLSRFGFPIAGEPHGSTLGWALQIGLLVLALFACWLVLLGWTGALSYFFRPRQLPVVLQNRAVALSYYTCAPLAWLITPAVVFAIARVPLWVPWYTREPLFWLELVGGAIVLMIVLACWVRAAALMRRIARSSPIRIMALIAYLPIAWSLIAGLAWLLVAGATFLALVIMSLRR